MRAFLFDVDAWLSSTDVSMMTAVEERGYLRLLLHAWKQEDCGLPDNDEVLAALSLMGDAWRKCGGKVRRCFEARDGRLFNARLLKEWEYQRKYHARQKKAAQTRWGDRSDPGSPPPSEPRGKRKDVPKDEPRDMPRHKPRDESGVSQGNPILNTAYAVEENQDTAAAANSLEGPDFAVPGKADSPPPLATKRSASELAEIGKHLQMGMRPGTPAPDGHLVGRVVDAMQSATVAELSAAIVQYRKHRSPPDSYGFWPIYLQDVLAPAKRAALGAITAPVEAKPVAKAPSCARCVGTGIVGGGVAEVTAEKIREAIRRGGRLCGCSFGEGWEEYFATDDEAGGGDGMPVIQRGALAVGT